MTRLSKTAHRVEKARSVLKMVPARPAPLVPSKLRLVEERAINATKTNGRVLEHRFARNAHVRLAKNEFVSLLYIYDFLFLLE